MALQFKSAKIYRATHTSLKQVRKLTGESYAEILDRAVCQIVRDLQKGKNK